MTPINQDRFLDVLFARDPNLRNEDGTVNHVLAAIALSQIDPPEPPPAVRVQRVDVNVAPGVYQTTYEVVDHRLAKPHRVVAKSFASEREARVEAHRRLGIRGGAYTLQAVDNDEYFHDTDYELLGNQGTYGVYSGCGLTPDAANLTVDLASGAIKHNAGYVAVAAAANAYTLVADASNERWAALCLDSAGAPVLVSGDAAASSSVEPTKPEIGDRVLLALYKVQAAQTVAASCEYQLDKRVLIPSLIRRTTTNFTKNANTTLADVTGLGFHVGASEVWGFEVAAQVSAPATPGIKLAFTVPTSATITGTGTLTGSVSGAVSAERSANFTSAMSLVATGVDGDVLTISGVVVNSTTAGIVQLQAAQDTSNASNTIIYANSFIRAWRIA